MTINKKIKKIFKERFKNLKQLNPNKRIPKRI